MPKLFRFLITIPAEHAPSPSKKDVEEELHYLLRRHFHGTKVSALRNNEIIMPVTRPRRQS